MGRNPRLISSCLFVLALLGCSTPPAKPLTAEQAQNAETERLCWGYHEFGAINGDASQVSRANIRAELIKRGVMNDHDWQIVDRQRVDTGIGRCAVLALFGIPSTANENGRIEVLAFGVSIFITLVDGKVTAYQVPSQYMLR